MTRSAKRMQALAEAAASLRLEGLGFDQRNADLFTAWVEGRMSGDEVRAQIIARAQSSGETVQVVAT